MLGQKKTIQCATQANVQQPSAPQPSDPVPETAIDVADTEWW